MGSGEFLHRFGLIAIAILSTLAAQSCTDQPKSAQGPSASPAKKLLPEQATGVIPSNQKPILKVFPPAADEQSQPGVGKFVIFTREPTGKDWDFIAGAWECIPSRPEIPIIKRVEFCHSSWNCGPLLDALVADDSEGLYPRFARLQVDSGEGIYAVNLYDINYKSWDVRCIWQGGKLHAYGLLGDSIVCKNADNWLMINTSSGKIGGEMPIVPLATDGDFWLVRKPGETEGCWTYDRRSRQFVAHFKEVESPEPDFSEFKISPDGTSRALVQANCPDGWRGPSLAGQLILQGRDAQEDIFVPIQVQAVPGSGVHVIPLGFELTFAPAGKLQFRASAGGEFTNDRVWTIDMTTGEVSSAVAPHRQENHWRNVQGIPVPDYLQENMKTIGYYKAALPPAFLMHLGILKEKPENYECVAGVSRDGRHVLYKALKGPLAGLLYYGDLHTKALVQWKWPDELKECNVMDFAWVETPAGTEPVAAPQRRE